jgi:Protein of unknown function (DUF1598)
MKTSFSCSISQQNSHLSCLLRRSLLSIVIVASVVLTTKTSWAQGGGVGVGLVSRVVGGVKVSPDGTVSNVTLADQQADVSRLRQQLHGGEGQLADPAKLRMVSLKAVQAAMSEAALTGKPMKEEIVLLGGLTRIEYVLAFPENNDIVLAGPSENWTLGPTGTIVGMESGRPIVCLEDLLVAFRAMSPNSERTISCSIDPTPEGTVKLNNMLKSIKLGPSTNPATFEASMKSAFGPQKVSLTGLAATSHVAHVLLAADYQMKRYGMNLAQAPVKGLPSYVEMIRNRSVKSPQNRWWMACDYQPIEQSEDGLAWQISGRGIKTLSEQEVIGDDGSVKQAGKTEVNAQKWAELFTSKLDELAVKDPVFGELRNVMDSCVISALIHSKELGKRANCDLSVLSGTTKSIEPVQLEAPLTLAPQCSFLKTAGGWVVTASGGVLIEGWKVVANTKTNGELQSIHNQAKPASQDWTWK